VFALEAPQAGRVAVCGEFNDWSLEATPMQRLHGHRWEATLALRPGRYQYKFVADGQWLADPQASATVPDGHGAINSVIEVAGN
jgi:1,4-alpha-glucan branching enzyme